MSSRVLIVDDEALSSHFLGLYLKDEGYEVREASSGSEALAVAEEFKPEILLSDWMLKDDIDGIAVAKALVARNPGIITIFMTGMASDVITPKLAKVPYAAVIEKPFEPETILEHLRSRVAQSLPLFKAS